MKAKIIKVLSLIGLLLWIIPVSLSGQNNQKLEKIAGKKLAGWTNPVKEWHYPEKISVDSFRVAGEKGIIDLWFPVPFSYNAIREENLSFFRRSISESLGSKFGDYTVNIHTNGFAVEDLIPNYYREAMRADSTRFPRMSGNRPVLMRRMNATNPTKGLNERYIALWHSHGYYFDMTLDRWEWQRAKIFGTVEDISVMGHVLPYLTRMLENSGATVFLPRERDTQVNEIIVDNDRSTGYSEFVVPDSVERQVTGGGFLMADTLFTGDNPFKKGTSLRIKGGRADYIADFPEKGNYAVYVSYPFMRDNCKAVLYTVTHSGGSTDFIVDQTVGGGTWIYLGTFQFNAGKDASVGAVSASPEGDGYMALDAVRFGGGKGNVARRPSEDIISNQRSVNENAIAAIQRAGSDTIRHTWKLSGKPRYMEGSRYYLQYAGMPDTLVYSLNRNKNDYNDDYQSRGEWVNYLMGTTESDDGAAEIKGLGLPIDLSLAFHTDAGVTPDDSIIGTLGIYSTAAGGGKFPDGSSRMASRDLTDIIQTQIVDDISLLFNPEWTRRGLWDRSYSEARKPNVPAMLLELLSHQNQGDQRYGLDPRFRFHVSRAVYKGMLRYLSYADGRDYVVQPLPVKGMAVLPLEGKRVKLSWVPVEDPLEPSAHPTGYRIYKRTGDNGFDNGTDVTENSAVIELDHYDTVYSFRVTAFNEGGESFPSETVAAGVKKESGDIVLVVNGFDRISGPSWFDRDGMAGVAWWNDRGVADHADIVASGDQYDYERRSPWTDDDNAGWGASYSDMEGKIIPGNTFDFPLIHGNAIMAAGSSFYSVSDEVFVQNDFNASSFSVVDLIMGEEKTTADLYDKTKHDFTIYTPDFMNKIKEITSSGASVFMSGSYVGTDLWFSGDSSAMRFAADYLHFKPMTGHAVKEGKVYPADIATPWFNGATEFNTAQTGEVYGAEAPDAIVPADKYSITAFRYTENNTSAGVLHNGKNRTLVLGFPFETIKSETDRNRIMKQALEFLLAK